MPCRRCSAREAAEDARWRAYLASLSDAELMAEVDRYLSDAEEAKRKVQQLEVERDAINLERRMRIDGLASMEVKR